MTNGLNDPIMRERRRVQYKIDKSSGEKYYHLYLPKQWVERNIEDLGTDDKPMVLVEYGGPVCKITILGRPKPTTKQNLIKSQ